MKIAVTGGAGFIGSHIVDAYIEEGHEVVVIDNLSTGKKENVNPKARFIEIDITDPEIPEIFEEERFDILSHHAAQANVRESVREPGFDAQVNIIGGINLYEAARESGVKKIIFSSTGGAIYGEQKYFPADERHPKRPCSPYGVSKLANEKYLVYYKTIHNIEHVIFRYTNVYGPRQNPKGEAGVVAIFISKMLAGEQPVIYGDGTQTRDYNFIDDVVRANVLALDEKAKGIYNCSTSEEHSVNTIFRILKYRMGSDAEEVYGPAQEGEQARSVCSHRKLLKALGWKPETNLEKGLIKTIEWFRENQA